MRKLENTFVPPREGGGTDNLELDFGVWARSCSQKQDCRPNFDNAPNHRDGRIVGLAYGQYRLLGTFLCSRSDGGCGSWKTRR